MKLAPTIIENLEYADIVRGSLEDFLYMYGMQDIDKIYKDKIKFSLFSLGEHFCGGAIPLRVKIIFFKRGSKMYEDKTLICKE